MSTNWDAFYRAGTMPWDKGVAAPPLLEWLETPGNRFDGELLVPGCGLGHDVRAIAATGQARHVCGLDFSPAALAAARGWAQAGGESYVEGDLFALPPEWRGRFDWVFEHTCFCAIDLARRADYVRAVAQVLRPGGGLLAVFYLHPWSGGEPPPPGGGPPFGTSVEELDALFADDFDLLTDAVPTRTYPGREGREVIRLLRKKT